MQGLVVVGCPTGGPGLALGVPNPPPCSQIQWAPQLVAPNGLATLMAMAQDCAHGLCTPHTMHSVPLGTCVLLEIEELFIKNRGILADFWVCQLGGVASVVNTGRPLPPHHCVSSRCSLLAKQAACLASMLK